MVDLVDKLHELSSRAAEIHSRIDTKAVRGAIKTLIAAADEAETSHSGSWLGYQALVYYNNLEKPPSGTFFDRQWGLKGRYSTETIGDWVQYNYSDIFDHLKNTGTTPSFDEIVADSHTYEDELKDVREDLLSIIEACQTAGAGEYFERAKEEVKKARKISAQSFVNASAIPPPPFTNDVTAVAGGTQVPPHAAFRASLTSTLSLIDSASTLAKVAKRVASHLENQVKAKAMLKGSQSGTRVFIGHGRSSAWLELKNYIQDRLGVLCDDFNREATAGHTTVARLTAMLNDACFAFLVLTAEDEQKDDKVRARQNVVHEAGLFQGRLGFEKAIIVLENGCDEFSNIHGLGQIRFDTGKISGSFHEVSDTLKREGVIG